jgi:beta-glucosidase
MDNTRDGRVPYPGTEPARRAHPPLGTRVRLLTGADNWRTAGDAGAGLRPMAFSDGPAGVRGVAMDERAPSSSLPCPSALGATWDPGLVAEVAAALGAEARGKGIDVLLAPTIHLMRTPLGGRGFECFAEDPVLTARIAVAFVRGVQSAGVACAAKHFICNDSETQRWTCNVQVAPHVLRELYLVPFEAVVREAGVLAVMAGYNSVNGATMTENAALLTRVLKDEWGFGGVVVSDWHAARSTDETAAAGLDLAMPGPSGPWGDRLADAVRAGRIAEAVVDDKVRRVLHLARQVGALDGAGGHLNGRHLNDGHLNGRAARGARADPALLRRAAAAAFTLLANPRGVLPLNPGALGTLAVIGPNALAPVTQGGGSAAVNQISVSCPADALRTALAGRAQVIAEPGCITWEAVPEPPPGSLTDPGTGEPGTRLEFRAPDGHLIAAEHRTATMFTWWEGLPDGIGWGGQGRILLRARFRADRDGAHLIGAGGVGRLALFVNGTGLAEGITPDPADPVEAMVRPGEIRATVTLRAGQEAEIQVALLPSGGAPGPVSIRLGVVPAPDEDALLAAAEQAARGADAAIVIVGSAPAAESEGFDRPGLALTGRQDELVRRIAAVNDRTVVVVNAGMPVLMPWADEVAGVGYAWLGGQAMGDALADVLLGAAEPGGRLPVTLPAAEADCPVLHADPRDGQLRYSEGLLIGYRGFDRAGTSPRFPFGHGLGYTTWALESARPAGRAAVPGAGRSVRDAGGGIRIGPGEDVELAVVVRNTGTRPGREVVQAYVAPGPSAPSGAGAGAGAEAGAEAVSGPAAEAVSGPAAEERTGAGAGSGRPVRALAAFGAAVAAPGETAEVRLCIPARAFARYDEQAGGWVWPGGEFTVQVGRSSRDLPLSVPVRVDPNLRAEFAAAWQRRFFI